MKGFGFLPFQLMSILFLNINKIPFFKRIINKIKPYLTKTGIWTIIIMIRKLIIIFNAIIGVYVVYKTTGITSESFLANFIGMGVRYIEIFTDFTKNLFT